MNKVTIFFNSTLSNYSILFTGLELLKERGEINLKYKLDLGRYHPDIFKVIFNDAILFFDLGDSTNINHLLYEQCDFYIKRMLLKEHYEKYPKLLPFGLFYSVYYKNLTLKYLFLRNIKLTKYSLRYFRYLSKILNVVDCINTSHLKLMESNIFYGDNITFRARLWNPEKKNKRKKEERIIMNTQRIEICKKLRNKYGDYFYGGIKKSSVAEKILNNGDFNDIILNSKEYHKKRYIKILKKSSIGVANQGLEYSIGCKLGEYIAHGIAIVTNPIDKFQLLGEFIEGENYLKYENVDECVKKVDLLFKDKNLREKIQKNNKEYYLTYLRPDQKLRKIFNMINDNNKQLPEK